MQLQNKKRFICENAHLVRRETQETIKSIVAQAVWGYSPSLLPNIIFETPPGISINLELLTHNVELIIDQIYLLIKKERFLLSQPATK